MPFGVRRWPDNCDPRTPCFGIAFTDLNTFPRAWKYLLQCWSVRKISTNDLQPIRPALLESSSPGDELRAIEWLTVAPTVIDQFGLARTVVLRMAKEPPGNPPLTIDDFNLYATPDGQAEVFWATANDLANDPYQAANLNQIAPVPLDADHEIVFTGSGDCSGANAFIEPRPWFFDLPPDDLDLLIDVSFSGDAPFSGVGGTWGAFPAAPLPTDETGFIRFNGSDQLLALDFTPWLGRPIASWTSYLQLRVQDNSQFNAVTACIGSTTGARLYEERLTDQSTRIRTQIGGLLQTMNGTNPADEWNHYWVWYDNPTPRTHWWVGSTFQDDSPAPDHTMVGASPPPWWWVLGGFSAAGIQWAGDIGHRTFWSRLLTETERNDWMASHPLP